ncbi:MAG: SPASM domain-containing protein [Lachnospiraceae bacterium]|nr:SPASM domain-containing protein [Lachnospiraceae bacterium]
MKQYFSFQWHITDECDQRCKHCYIFSENTCKKLDSMNYAQIEDTFYNCLDFCRVYDRLPYFYITGGDPILHPDFWKLLLLMKNHDIPFTILGNPFHLDDTICQKLKEYGCQKYQGAGVNVFAFARYCPTSDEKDTGMTPQEYRNLLTVCDKKFKAHEASGSMTYFNKKDHLWMLYEYETGAFKIPETIEDGMIYGGCNCGNCHLTILPNGDVYACRRVQNSKIANVFTDRLADVWVCEMETYRQYNKFEKCTKCELLAWCRGCPAVASGKDGNFYAADPQCWKEIS